MATAKPGDPGQAGKLDPHGPNKFEPEHHEPFPNQPNKGHSAPGDNKKNRKGK